MVLIIGIMSAIIGLVIHFLPTIIAFRKNAYNKLFILALNIIPDIISIILGIILYVTTFNRYNASLVGGLSPFIELIGTLLSIIFIIIWIIALVKAIRSY